MCSDIGFRLNLDFENFKRMMSWPIKKDRNWMELNYQRQQNLVIKHGTYVLRCILDRFIPANQLQATLQTSQIKTKIINDGNRNILSQKQIDQLYPSNGQPNPEDFDITLLTYILRNHCGPHLDPKSPFWSIKDNVIIPRANTDIVADIVRLRNLRNKLNHNANASLDKNEFETDWSLAEEVLLRLAARCGINDMKEKIENVILESQTPELKGLREDTARFLQDYHDGDSFVETKAVNEAHRLLEKNNVVVLEGDRGEGKSTMAARLALKSTEPKHCLKLKYSSDWHHVDMSGNMFNVIIIDGMTQWYWDNWKDVLSEISSAVEKKQIKVILTSNSYRDILGNFGDIPMFKNTGVNGPVVQLKSTDLLEEEKIAIFQAQAKRCERQVPLQLVMECVQNYREHIDTRWNIGFPKYVSLFLTYDDIYNNGSVFFKSAVTHLKAYFRKMFNIDPEGFTSLAMVALKEDKVLSYEEIKKAKTTTDHVERVASLFGRKVDDDFLETLKQSLESNVGVFLEYDERTEQYSFTHSIIGDIVQQVLAEKIAEQANQISPSDSRMEHGGLGEHQTLNFKKRKIETCC